MYVWTCGYCGEEHEAPTPGDVNVAGRTHLLETHRARVRDRVEARLVGATCNGACEYEFPAEPAGESPFICPRCGHDNLVVYADEFVWSDIERV